MDCFLFDRDLRHERVKKKIQVAVQQNEIGI